MQQLHHRRAGRSAGRTYWQASCICGFGFTSRNYYWYRARIWLHDALKGGLR